MTTVNAFIAGTGSYLPPREVTNTELLSTHGIDASDEWIERRTGIRARRFAEEGVGSADLAVPACEQAIARAGIDRRDIDLIVFATLSPEHVFPGSGVYLNEKLGLYGDLGHKSVGALDIRNQCSGFLYGLGVATSMVKAGQARHVLVVGAETHSAALDFSTRGRDVCTLFGDGAGAVVVSATEEDRGLRGLVLGADGRHADRLRLKGWDIRKRPYIAVDADGVGRVPPEDLWPRMDGFFVFKHAAERMSQALLDVCSASGRRLEDVDLFLLHQANLRINQFVQQRCGIPDDKVINNIDRYGNTTAATIPILMDEAAQRGFIQPGTTVAAVAFGSGFTWGAALIDW